MMGILSETLEIDSPLTPEQARKVVEGFTETGPYNCSYVLSGECPGYHKNYHGFVSEQRFNISRILHYRGISPLVIGKFSIENRRTVVRVSIKPNFVFLFIFIVILILTLSFSWLAISGFIKERDNYTFLPFFAVSVTFVIISWRALKDECATDKVFFERIFKTPLDSD